MIITSYSNIISMIVGGIIDEMMMLNNTSKIDLNGLVPILIVVTHQLLILDPIESLELNTVKATISL